MRDGGVESERRGEWSETGGVESERRGSGE